MFDEEKVLLKNVSHFYICHNPVGKISSIYCLGPKKLTKYGKQANGTPERNKISLVAIMHIIPWDFPFLFSILSHCKPINERTFFSF